MLDGMGSEKLLAPKESKWNIYRVWRGFSLWVVVWWAVYLSSAAAAAIEVGEN